MKKLMTVVFTSKLFWQSISKQIPLSVAELDVVGEEKIANVQ